MTRNQRFAMMSMGRPFVPTLAKPTGLVGSEARQMLIYIYPLHGAIPTVQPENIWRVPAESRIFNVPNETRIFRVRR